MTIVQFHTRCARVVLLGGALVCASHPPILAAQTPQRIDATVDAQSGVLGAAFPVPRSPLNGNALFQASRTGVQSTWHVGAFQANVAGYLAFASTLDAHTTLPLGAFRLSTHHGPVTLSLGLEQSIGVTASRTTDTSVSPNDTFSFPPPTVANAFTSALVRASDVVGGLEWNTAIASVQILTGVRANDARAGVWTGANAAWFVGRSNAVTLSLRSHTSPSAIRTPTFSLGFRSSYWHWGNDTPAGDSSSTRPARASHGHVLSLVRTDVVGDTVYLHVHLPAAQHIAIMGDATDWLPVAMTGDAQGWWHVPLHVNDAVSRLQLRSDDGAWRPIPGLPAARDEYGGTVSLLVNPANRK